MNRIEQPEVCDLAKQLAEHIVSEALESGGKMSSELIAIDIQKVIDAERDRATTALGDN